MRILFSLILLLFFSAVSEPGALFAALDEARLERQFQQQVLEAPLPPPAKATSSQQLVARAAVEGMLDFHYDPPEMTPALVEQWRRNYFQMLDPSKMYFLQSDLQEFQRGDLPPHPLEMPDLPFAFQVYQRYLERLQEWTIFAFQAYGKDWDFQEKDTLPLYDSPEEREWPASLAERESLWSKMVKNAILADKLTQEDIQARQAQEGDEEGEKKAVYTPPPLRLRNRNALLDVFRMRVETQPDEVIATFLNAFATLLDPHSCYYPPEDKEDFDIAMSLSLQGIGATLTWRDSYTMVMSLVPGGPAAKDGRLRPGDRIVAVAQSPTEEPQTVVGMPLDKVVRLIRGRKGTKVYLTVQSEGSSAEKVIILVRDEIHLKDSEAQSQVRMVEGKRILTIYLPSFYRDFGKFNMRQDNANAASTTRDVEHLLEKARAEGPVDGLILDLRNNGGGSLEEAIQLSSLFLGTPGRMPVPVVQTRERSGRVQVRVSTPRKNPYTGPLMVLVDRGAASATEILAACLQDTGRAVVVGDPGTHGKGSVQAVMDLRNTGFIKRNWRFLQEDTAPGSLKVTIQKFYRINGGSTQIRGVTPDLQFPSFQMAFKNTEGDLPHALAWDEISPVPSVVPQTRAREFLPALQEFYREYAAGTPAFQRYSRDVEEYLEFRRIRVLPLEIQARREYRERELELARKFRHYQPERDPEERERLHDADEAIYDDGAPKEDVVLEASLAIMGKMISLDQQHGRKAFSVGAPSR